MSYILFIPTSYLILESNNYFRKVQLLKNLLLRFFQNVEELFSSTLKR